MKLIAMLVLAFFYLSASFGVWAGEDAQGKQVFEKWCMPCHGKGTEYPGTLALDARYKGAVPAALEDRADLTPPLVKYFVRNGISVMPFFRKTEISDSELDALAHYLQKQPAQP
ncbi:MULTISPECIES: c-type cytochrome [unclassified Pseudomonas]|jgi:mono/diheme cytochrome c family protein|uniref:c-type cytochrome n=1 Tax=unclassified Pseudomonas TaxID=196821 RepID=UPI0009E81CC7|nr:MULTISPECIES: cytochrome c [unclassified Pseudomonas]WPN49662.1 cytochrome c [Pseudomonas sp. P8_241]